MRHLKLPKTLLTWLEFKNILKIYLLSKFNYKQKEQSSLNFEALSTNLNVKLDILITYRNLNNNNSEMKSINAELVTIEQLITLHPLLCQLWMKLGNSIYLLLKICETEAMKRDYLLVYLYVCQLTDHYFAFRGSIVKRQKQQQKDWVTKIYPT